MNTPDSAEAVENLGLLVCNNDLVEGMRTGLRAGVNAYDLVPSLLREIIDDQAWRDRIDRNGKRHRFAANRFIDFIEQPPPAGLGVTLDEMRRYLGDSSNPLRIEFEAMIDRGRGGSNNPDGCLGKPGREINPNNIRVDSKESEPTPAAEPEPRKPRDRSREPQAGTGVGYATRRLGRERPDLLDRVKAGELSANAAMIAAGFRAREFMIPAEPRAAARRLVRHFSREQFGELVDAALDCYGVARARPGTGGEEGE